MSEEDNIVCFTIFFFCKQKTAYERRISDWSSDVCSSDLIGRIDHRQPKIRPAIPHRQRRGLDQPGQGLERVAQPRRLGVGLLGLGAHFGGVEEPQQRRSRSEEHTSELQSLMRISYAVCCLKKNKNTRHHNTLTRTSIHS